MKLAQANHEANLMAKFKVVVGLLWLGIHMSNFANPGAVIVLQGTSSSGKSSISAQLATLLAAQAPETVSIDHFLWSAVIEKAKQLGLITADMPLAEMQKIVMTNKAVVFADFVKTNWLEPKKQCYQAVKNLALAGKLVILDTVLDEVGNSQEFAGFYAQMQGVPVFLVLVYCPPVNLAQHVFTRNSLVGYEQKRDIVFVLKQYCRLYMPTEDAAALDTFTWADLQQCLATVTQDLQLTGATDAQLQAALADLTKTYQANYHLQAATPVVITAKRPYDFLVHTGQSSALACAQLIYAALLTRKIALKLS